MQFTKALLFATTAFGGVSAATYQHPTAPHPTAPVHIPHHPKGHYPTAPIHTAPDVTKTKVVTAYVTYCPEPTTFTGKGGKTYTATATQYVTVTDCPSLCTVTYVEGPKQTVFPILPHRPVHHGWNGTSGNYTSPYKCPNRGGSCHPGKNTATNKHATGHATLSKGTGVAHPTGGKGGIAPCPSGKPCPNEGTGSTKPTGGNGGSVAPCPSGKPCPNGGNGSAKPTGGKGGNGSNVGSGAPCPPGTNGTCPNSGNGGNGNNGSNGGNGGNGGNGNSSASPTRNSGSGSGSGSGSSNGANNGNGAVSPTGGSGSSSGSGSGSGSNSGSGSGSENGSGSGNGNNGGNNGAGHQGPSPTNSPTQFEGAASTLGTNAAAMVIALGAALAL